MKWVPQSSRGLGTQAQEYIFMYIYTWLYIGKVSGCYSPGPLKPPDRQNIQAPVWEGGRGKSLMLLASNNKSWSYLPPCLIKYLEKKTLWLIRLLHWSNIDCTPFCCPGWVKTKWWPSCMNKLLATTTAETKINLASCWRYIGACWSSASMLQAGGQCAACICLGFII